MKEDERTIRATIAYLGNIMGAHGSQALQDELRRVVIESQDPVMLHLSERYTFFAERHAYLNAFFDLVDEGWTMDEQADLFEAAKAMDDEDGDDE